MGYETQLIVGIDTGQEYDGKKYFMVVTTIDMCKLGNTSMDALPWKNKNPYAEMWEWYPPTGDGNTPTTCDRYGDYPRPVPLGDVIAAIEKDMTRSDYRRLKWAHALLTAIYEGEGEGGETFSVLLWGH